MFEQAQNELLTVRDLLRFAVSRFNEAELYFGHGSDNAWDEAAYLTLHSLHLPLNLLDPYLSARLTSDERAKVLNLIEQRIKLRVPASYLTHEAWLGEYSFYVDERVIVPRSHIAELLNEQLSPWIKDPWAVHHTLDLCTGSACLAILAGIAFPESQVDAVDISPEALQVARRNVDDYELAERIELIESDAFNALSGRTYDLIISNPPYVRADAMEKLPQEYRREPQLALAGGDDGLDFIHLILNQAKRFLNPEGILVVELGDNREALEEAYPDTAFVWLDTGSGNPSVFMLRSKDFPLKREDRK